MTHGRSVTELPLRYRGHESPFPGAPMHLCWELFRVTFTHHLTEPSRRAVWGRSELSHTFVP